MRKTLIAALVAGLLVCSVPPLAWGRKNNKKEIAARIESLQTIYVDGSSFAVSYISKHLSQETCLNNTPLKTEADAILEVWEESPVRCGPTNQAMYDMCSHIQAKLLDAKTKKILWYREDEHLPQVDMIHHLNGPYEWVLWNLKNSCCKGRPSGGSHENSKE